MASVPWGLPDRDLDRAVERVSADLSRWRGARVLVTGATGFLGSWLVGTLLRANEVLDLGLRLVVLTRDPTTVPLAPGPCLELVAGDVRDLPPVGQVDAIVHGAAASASRFGVGDGEPRVMAATIVDGTRAVLDAAASSGARVLFLSSGAVYGRQVVDAVPEDHAGGPDPLDPRSAYGEAKRMAENWCAATTAAGEAEVVVARLFAFVGPRLPLDRHFAAGNFLADVLASRPVRISGDGRTVRSYLYAGDVPEWLFALLSRGVPGRAYNVGSPEAVTIAELASRAARLADPPLPVQVIGAPSDTPASRYVPDTRRAEDELGLRPRVGLDEGLRRSLAWFAVQRG
ncbi:MAG TPA: NAD-dependent epimerase/dehydratase family protein [Acidimicrobiales bacterium]|nr:NAD-dependent epimerase/dehydratase family protein [Acidimicrobiales bacterium]